MVSGAEASTADGGGFGEVVEFGEPRSALNTLSSQASTSLPSSCTVLTCTDPNNPFGGDQSFYIVGTAHVSTESCEDVRKVIQEVKPEVSWLCSFGFPADAQTSSLTVVEDLLSA